MSKAKAGDRRAGDEVLEAAREAARRDGLSFAEWMGRRLTEHESRTGGPKRLPQDGHWDSLRALSNTLDALERRLREGGDDPVIKIALSDIEGRLRAFAESRPSGFSGPDAPDAKNRFPQIRNEGAVAAPLAGARVSAMQGRIAQLAGKLDEMCRGGESELTGERETARIGKSAVRDSGFPARPRQILHPRPPGADERARAQGTHPSDEALKRIEGRLDALAARTDETLCAAFEKHRAALSEHIREAHQRIAERVDESAAAASRDLDDLRAFVGARLKGRETEPEAPATRLAVEALARDFSEIHGRLDRADENFAALRLLEPAIAAMAGRIEETRRLAAEAADAANRAASQDHLSGAAARELEQRLTREIADLRVFQDESDRRAHLSESAAQETVGQFADRLAKLEASLGEARPGQAPFGSPLAPGLAQGLAQAPARDRIDAIRIGDRTPAGGADQTTGSDPRSGLDETDDILIEPGGGFPRAHRKREARVPGATAEASGKADPGGGPGRTDFVAAAPLAPKTSRPAGGAEIIEPIPRGGVLFGARKHPAILGAVAAVFGLGAYVCADAWAGRSLDGPAALETFVKKLLSAEGLPDDTSRVVAQDAPQAPDAIVAPPEAFDVRLFDPRPLGAQDIEPWRLAASQKTAPATGGATKGEAANFGALTNSGL